MIVAGVLVGLGGLILSILVFLDHSGHKLWFYWIAPLLGIAFAGMMIQLTVAYWMKVGRLEVKGRPRK
jgi:hypothetical protein